jgi:hypothetical protein
MLKPFTANMAKPSSATRKSKPRKKSAVAKRTPPRKRRSSEAKTGAEAELPLNVSVGRLERTRRLLLAALRVWELKRRVRD